MLRKLSGRKTRKGDFKVEVVSTPKVKETLKEIIEVSIPAAKEEVKEIKQEPCLFLTHILEPVRVSTLDLDIIYPIVSTATLLQDTVYFILPTITHGDVFLPRESVEAVASKFAEAKRFVEASQYYHLVNSTETPNKPAWVIS